MKKFVVILIALASAETAMAKDLVFTLYCTPMERRVGAPLMRVYKTAKQVRGKWENSYSLEVRPINPTAKAQEYKFKHAGSGDEDYNEYVVVGKGSGVSGAAIQNSFRWANLIDEEGSIFARCAPAR